jgi:ubiquinone/menaquinone biosynthesis C-methylase UbiE
MGRVGLMPNGSIDSLTSPTLKYLRERWWNQDFTEFLTETLRPRSGDRILDVGCGEGLAEVHISRLHLPQIRLFGVDLIIERVMVARHEAAAHNQRVGFAAADACDLPFRDGAFDATFCVAVLQHVRDVEKAVKEFARITAPGGHVVAVEPDNAGRYSFSSTPAGTRAFETAARFFSALAAARGDVADSAVGPKMPVLFARHDIEVGDVRLFPVSNTRLGSLPKSVWTHRIDSVKRAMDQASTEEAKALGREYIAVLEAAAAEAEAAGPAYVEIQNTMLFATVGRRME